MWRAEQNAHQAKLSETQRLAKVLKQDVQLVDVRTLVYAQTDDLNRRCLEVELYLPPFSESCDFRMRSLWAFLRKLTVQPVNECHQGVTWIEILMLYELRVGPYDVDRVRSERYTGVPCKRILSSFKRQIKGIVREHGFGWVKLMFKPSRCSQHRLASMGYSHHVPHTSFIPVATTTEARAISLSLLSLRMKTIADVRHKLD